MFVVHPNKCLKRTMIIYLDLTMVNNVMLNSNDGEKLVTKI